MPIRDIPPNYQRIIDDAWLGIKVKEDTLYNPLDHIPIELEDEPHVYLLWLMQQPEYFSFLCKEVMGVQLLPVQALMLKEMWNRRFPMLIASRGFGKSYMLALYALLRILLLPARRVVICGAAFRQSKVIFNYMESIWYNAPLFRDLCGQNAGPRHEPDMFRFHIGDSVALALPIGDGSRIRGQRANDIIGDEFAAQSKEVFENVIGGFAVVKSSPIDSVQDRAARDLALRLGWTPPDGTNVRLDNQIILSGTAYYDFNHFGEYWKRWRTIIRSKGDRKKLRELFGDDEIHEDFDWHDYSIIRLPFELVPRGFMDEAMVARSKATIHSGIYLMEFGACVHPDTLITTNNGVKKIIDVNVGDYVLTHKGRFRKVVKRFCRPYCGPTVSYKTVGHNQVVGVTPEHPFWMGGDDFDSIVDKSATNLTNLNELNITNQIDVLDFVDNVLETYNGDRIYPRGSKSNIDLNQQRCVRRNFKNHTQEELAQIYNTSQSAISYVQRNLNIPKNSVSRYIELDYDFGLIVGYYAAEGNISKNGNAVEFALDEHRDTLYQAQLLQAIENVFGFCGKSYTKQKNTVVININSRIVADLLRAICPGKSATKLIDHQIIFSNEAFLKGVIEGYWNGDGHIRMSDQWASAHCINQSLLNQIRLGLSYFNISSSLMNGSQDNDYKLNMSGDNFRQFMFEFYHKTLPDSDRKQNLTNDDEKSICNILSMKNGEYNGYVYNLEVEEDNSYSLLNATVHNCFSNDSNGFFKRSLIESCVLSNENEITLPSGKIEFSAALRGHKDCQYVYGIDPASEVDNFSIVILEHHPDHRRIVYSWTTNRKEHKERIRKGLSKETDFYSYCGRKIRELMKVFPCERIAMDSQGGGIAVSEALHDLDKIDTEEGEVQIWPTIEAGKPQDTDGEPGLHIIEMINFSSSDWTSEANHGLRKDFEDKACLFPFFDTVSLGLAKIIDDQGDRLYDTLEDCLMEIEELKNELSTIAITQTLNGRDRWDTPEVKLPGNKKGRLRKDRYSSLVMANMVSRQMARNPEKYFTTAIGGWAGSAKAAGDKRDYVGSSWLAEGLSDIYQEMVYNKM